MASSGSVEICAAAEGVAYRVADLRTEPLGTFYHRDALELESAGSLAYFSGDDRIHGIELWASDGTVAGMRMVKDLLTGRNSGQPLALSSAGSILYFVACTPEFGCEPWRSDGTAGGTFLLRDIWPGPGYASFFPIAAVGDRFFFAATDPQHGTELWVSDGTAVGTRLVADIRPGAGSSLLACNVDISETPGHGLAGRLLFSAWDEAHGCELWRSDGTAQGTYLLKSLLPGTEGGRPTDFRRLGSSLLFRGTGGSHGRELWVTDGSAQGTRIVRDLSPGRASSTIWPFGSIGEKFLFGLGEHGRSDLWSTDGTEAGTRLVRSFSTPGAGESLGTRATAIGGRVVFCAYDSEHGREPWTSDGTPSGTRILVDLVAGPSDSHGCPIGLGREGVYLSGFDGLSPAIWVTDGTTLGTRHAGSIGEPGELRFAQRLAAGASGTILDACSSSQFDCRLWRSDGTASGTQRIFPEPIPPTSSNPSDLTARPGGIVFHARPNGDFERIVRSDGTESGTYPLTSALTGVAFSDRATLPDGEVAFGARGVGGMELWRTSGDTLQQVGDLEPGPGDSYPGEFVRAGELVYFGASGFASRGLWKTDGTLAGTVHLSDAERPMNLVQALGRVWFGAGGTVDGPQIGQELWESSGTQQTTFAHDLAPGSGSTSPFYITAVEGVADSLAFLGIGSACQLDSIYRFDVATGEAEIVRTLAPELHGPFRPPGLASLGARFYFFDHAPGGTCALWSSSGATDSFRVKHVGAGFGATGDEFASCPTRLVPHAGKLFFTACGPLAGCELWSSDGSTAGTARVADLVPGPGSSFPRGLTSIGDRLYFEACSAMHGCEPWVTDGSAAGLHRLADIAPGAASSGPSEFTASEGLVYFAADDGTGIELWAMPIEVFYDGFEDGNLGRWDDVAPGS